MLEHCWTHIRNDYWLWLRYSTIKHRLENSPYKKIPCSLIRPKHDLILNASRPIMIRRDKVMIKHDGSWQLHDLVMIYWNMM